MRQGTRITIGVKMIGSFLIIAALAAAIGAIGIGSVWKVNGMAATMYERETIGLRYTAATRQYILHTARFRAGILDAAA